MICVVVYRVLYIGLKEKVWVYCLKTARSYHNTQIDKRLFIICDYIFRGGILQYRVQYFGTECDTSVGIQVVEFYDVGHLVGVMPHDGAFAHDAM